MDGSIESASVLVVEDNPDLNVAICEILESYEFITYSASDGFEALESLEKQTPDVILCDIMMPGMDGYTLLQHTRADQALRTLPFIFLTARTSTEDQKRAKGIGIEDYLTKPIDESLLVAAIRNALRRQHLMEEQASRQMDALRHEIVGLLQHEFRTPLTFILGYAEYIQDSTNYDIDLDDLRQSTSAILKGGRRLQRMIESFLLLAELQRRELETDELHERTAITLWRETAGNARAELTDAEMEIEVIEKNTSLLIACDPELIAEGLRRLVDNSIRYRRPESKKITVSVEYHQPYVGLALNDDSSGIQADELAKLSRPFEQADRTNRTTAGAGLSLTLVHHIARIHGGSFEIESEYGVGTTCTLWVPAAIESDFIDD